MAIALNYKIMSDVLVDFILIKYSTHAAQHCGGMPPTREIKIKFKRRRAIKVHLWGLPLGAEKRIQTF